MTGYLLDTNVLSEFTKIKPNTAVVEWVASIPEDSTFVSVLTLGEISKGVAKLPEGKRRVRLHEWLRIDLSRRFSGRVLEVSEPIALRWGVLAAQYEAEQKRLPVVDGLIAATALEIDLILVTRNTKDFSGSGVVMINPWEAGEVDT